MYTQDRHTSNSIGTHTSRSITSIIYMFLIMGQQLEATSVAGHSPSRLLYITDNTSELKFLTDTGAEVSVVPRSHTHQKTQCKGPILQAINNTTIPTYGTCSQTLNLGLCCTFRWFFSYQKIRQYFLCRDRSGYNRGHFQGNLRCCFSDPLWSFSGYEIVLTFWTHWHT